MGMAWDSKTPQAVKNFKLTNQHFNYLYLQLENNKICVKMNLDGKNFNAPDVRYAWDNVRNYFRKKFGAEFEFVRFAFSRGNNNSRWMTVGYTLYDEKNYQQQIQKVQQAFNAL